MSAPLAARRTPPSPAAAADPDGRRSPPQRPGKRAAELPKNAPSACTVLGELDTRYREWPEEVVSMLAHPASLEPKRHRGPRPAFDPDVKITGEHLVADSDEMRRLRDEMGRAKREMLRLQRDQDLTESALRIAATEKANFETLKLLATPPHMRTANQNRFVHKAVANTGAGPRYRYANTPSPMPLQPADSFDRTSRKRQVVGPPVAASTVMAKSGSGRTGGSGGGGLAASTIPHDTLPVMPSRDRPPATVSSGFPVMNAFVARSTVAGRPTVFGEGGEKSLGVLRRRVEEMEALAQARKPPPGGPKGVRFATPPVA